MTSPVPPAALAAARAAVPFVNGDACRRILAAGAPAIEAAERERIRQRLLACRECGHIHGASELFAGITGDHENRAPWVPAGPDALPFLDALLGEGELP